MNQNKNKIFCSVGILTLNSEKTLPRALKSVKDFSEIIICDGNSTDRTIEIAKSYGAKIIKQYETNRSNIKINDFSEVRNKCLKASSYGWFLYIDSDEELSKEAKEEIRKITQKENPEILIYQLPNKIIYNGRIIKYATPYPGYQTRFFNKKSGAYFIKNIHERLSYNKKLKIGILQNPWYVFITDGDYDDFWGKLHFYINKEVQRAKDQTFQQFFYWTILRQPLKILKIFFKLIYRYIRYGFKDSLPIKFEFQKIIYSSYLFYYLVKARIIKNK